MITYGESIVHTEEGMAVHGIVQTTYASMAQIHVYSFQDIFLMSISCPC